MMEILELNCKTSEFEVQASSRWFKIVLDNGDQFDIMDEGGVLKVMANNSINIKPQSGNVILCKSVRF